MSFAAGFYTFIGKIYVDSDEKKFSLKTPRHPEESLLTLQSRLLSYILYFKDEMTFSSGMFEPEIPAAFTKSFDSPYERSVFLNIHSEKELKKLKSSSKEYFLTFESLEKCKIYIKHTDSQDQLPEQVEILPELFLTEDSSKYECTFTIVEETVYVLINDESIDFERKFLSKKQMLEMKFEETPHPIQS